MLAEYLERVEPQPLVMQSSGGVVDVAVAVERPASCVLSGPAAGVVGAAFVAAASGFEDVISFDMGGTSTDVACVLGGEVQATAESVVAGVPIRFPMVEVHTIGAGGGSIAWVDEGGALRVGPRSAAARPGPACYGFGGEEPTVTDANVALGYLADGAVLGGEVTLDRALAERALERLPLFGAAVEVALGVIRVAEAEMVRALRVVSVERGIDPRGLALVAFGGAGPLHACALAEELGMDRVLVPRTSGVLSALGLAVADLRRDYVAPAAASFEELEARAREDLPGAEQRRLVDARYRGQSYELTVDADGWESLFPAAHEQRYGFRLDADVELVNRRVVAVLQRPRPQLRGGPLGERRRLAARLRGRGLARSPGAPPRLAGRRPGDRRASGRDLPRATRLGRRAGRRRNARTGANVDPVTLSVMSAALSGIAEEMGTALIRSASSSNIKERRDCSAALFDARGRMVAQAEHIPVHLGAMPESVAAVIACEPRPGDVFVLNDPFAGGSHLPDITLVSPLDVEGEIVGYACTRAHHSDVGGSCRARCRRARPRSGRRGWSSRPSGWTNR